MITKYTEWLQDKELLELIETEPLSIEEVTELQKHYSMSLTSHLYIILDPSMPSNGCIPTPFNTGMMAGDTNVFIKNDDDEGMYGELNVFI